MKHTLSDLICAVADKCLADRDFRENEVIDLLEQRGLSKDQAEEFLVFVGLAFGHVYVRAKFSFLAPAHYMVIYPSGVQEHLPFAEHPVYLEAYRVAGYAMNQEEDHRLTLATIATAKSADFKMLYHVLNQGERITSMIACFYAARDRLEFAKPKRYWWQFWRRRR